MATQTFPAASCRIYRKDQLDFDVKSPFSTLGGYGDLFRASYTEGGELALKRLRWGTEDGVNRSDRFELAMREADVWQDLSHPNIIYFLGLMYWKEDIYLISPFATNGPLPKYLKAHPDADRTAFIRQIAAGLRYLHDRQIVHGDVKGGNVLVSMDVTAQLCDFGLAKFASTVTSKSSSQGSLQWLSPERWKGDSPRTQESDVYAFGMTIYEILSGLIPFQALGIKAMYQGICEGDERPPASPATSATGISYEPLWLVAKRCWAKQPDQRLTMEQAYELIPSTSPPLDDANLPSTPTPTPPQPRRSSTDSKRKRTEEPMVDVDARIQDEGSSASHSRAESRDDLPIDNAKRPRLGSPS